MICAQQLASLIQAARQRAFKCEHGHYRNQCGWCVLEMKYPKMGGSVYDILHPKAFSWRD